MKKEKRVMDRDGAFIDSRGMTYKTPYKNTGEKIEHHGIKGQKWGIRRYQNSDGSLTEAGRKRYDYTSYQDHLYNSPKKQGLGGKLERFGQSWAYNRGYKKGQKYRKLDEKYGLGGVRRKLYAGAYAYDAVSKKAAARKTQRLRGLYEGYHGQTMSAEQHKKLGDDMMAGTYEGKRTLRGWLAGVGLRYGAAHYNQKIANGDYKPRDAAAAAAFNALSATSSMKQTYASINDLLKRAKRVQSLELSADEGLRLVQRYEDVLEHYDK